MQSMNEKRCEVDNMAVKIGYHSNIELTEEQERFVWDLIDFGYWEDKVMVGKCSLQAQINFDSEVWEKQMDADIYKLNAILTKKEEPRDNN